MSGREPLIWSSRYSVAPQERTKRLTGDKILLPQSALEQLLSAAPISSAPFNGPADQPPASRGFGRQQQLPHPLTFRLVNPENGRVVYSGVREFSAEEGSVGLSGALRQSLGIDDIDTSPEVMVHAKHLPKGTFVALRPLAAGYDTEDWKALLERHLRSNYTTLTAGEVLIVPKAGAPDFQFFVDKVEPEGDAICIVDTDLEVDLEPLNEEQALETLKKRHERSLGANGSEKGSSIGGSLEIGQIAQGRVARGEYVDYEISDWSRNKALELTLEGDDGAHIDLFVSPLSARQRARPRADEHVFGRFSGSTPTTIRLDPTNVALEDAESIYVSVFAFSGFADDGSTSEAFPYHIKAVNTGPFEQESGHSESEEESEDEHEPDEVQCKNCLQWVPQRTAFLHENFCLRNNAVCPKCRRIFKKGSLELQKHWHCPYDEANGDDEWTEKKHESIYHLERSCPGCNYHARSLPELALHRTTTCPAKLILCQFCHLVVPQKGESDPEVTDPEVLLSNLTPHELIDGGRTTECYLCNKILRLRDMRTHMKHHDLDRLSRQPPRICSNANCCRTVAGFRSEGKPLRLNNDKLGLCQSCFGPLHAPVYDPEGKALRRRIERRYLTQMLSGCGRNWCHNRYCKIGRRNENIDEKPLTTKEIVPLIRPLMDGIMIDPAGDVNTAPLYFCTDENNQKNRILAESLVADANDPNGYDLPWCVAAVEATCGDFDRSNEWLTTWTPRRREVRRR